MKQLTALALAALPLCTHASADTAEPEALPTAIVTGELWESDLNRTTASISLLEGESFEQSGSQHFEDIVNAIPNLTWTGGTSRPRYLQIRGVGENSQFEGETPDSSVRFLVDDLDFTGLGTIGNLFDVDQVEVLRGPQAGAFGANAAGGVVKITTHAPTPFWTGQVEGTVGTDSLFAGGLAVGGPVLENDPEQLTFRLAVHQLQQDGFRDNRYLHEEDSNERDELTSRLKLRWIASPDWQWDGTLFYADADNGYDEFSLDNTEFDIYSDEPGRDEQESYAGSLRGTWTGLDKAELTSITSYSRTDSLYSYDSDWGAGYIGVPDDALSGYYGFLETERERDVFSQELRLDSVDRSDAWGWVDRWTLGTYFQTLEEDTDTFYIDEYGTMAAGSKFETSNLAGYGQMAHDFSESTRLIIGLRAEYYEVETTSKGTDAGYYAGSLMSGKSDADEFLWGGKVTLEHDLSQAQMLFASFARGYKAGGANVASFTLPGDPLTYDNETLYNLEFGLRSDWFDGKLVTQVTTFYLLRKDAQLRDSQGAGGFFRYLTVNGEDAEHYGLEAEATWYLNDQFTASAGLGLLETDRESYNDPSGKVASRELSNAPAFTFNARIDYEAGNGFFANAEVVGSDDYYESNSHNEKRSAFAVVNAAVGYRYQNWTLTLWAKNLFDEEYEKRIFYFDNYHPDDAFVPNDRRYEDPANPQQFGVTMNYKW
ncbi:TonB-dependent receptor [Coraliomargarita parva]|uniref:TonB-dependent receptor n=1 Tax=Coraliomargarita parva TaxID=3014050 RepID=UPI0022B3EBDD|nr:TonB-dependent receptor [Coraliomargarita parva]